jgi:hypothetical protein
MNLQNFYTWEAEKSDGTIVKKGADLEGCVRFSLIPVEGTGLPQHDLIGVPMIRRFGRGFINALGGGIKEYLHCVVCPGFRIYVKSSTGAVLITPQDYEVYL